MARNAQKILEAAKEKEERTKISLYLSVDLYERFKKKCDDKKVPASRVVEELMKEWLENI